MASDSVPKNPSASVTSPEQPIDIVNESLDQAHATLDLLYTISTDRNSKLMLGSLCTGTLTDALNSAMCAIVRAKEAADELHTAAWNAAQKRAAAEVDHE